MAQDIGMWDQIRGNWKQLKGKVREKWGLLTDDDLEHIAGHKDRLVGKIQERYGEAKWESSQIENEMREMNRGDAAGRPVNDRPGKRL